LEEVKVFFEAPKPTSAVTITKEKEKEFEANFQWVTYTLLVQDLRDNQFYIYKVSLHPWGETKGDALIVGANSQMEPDETVEVKVSPEDIEKVAKGLLIKPDLFPQKSRGLRTNYVNIHKSDLKSPKKGTEYTPQEFEREFGTDFYVVLRRDRQFQNPLGGPVEGKKGEPTPEKSASDTASDTAIKKVVGPEGKEMSLIKLRQFPGSVPPSKIIRPEKGPGSYRRQEKHRERWMPVANILRSISIHSIY